MFAPLLLLLAMHAREAQSGCADFDLIRGFFGLLVDTCPSKSGPCCGRESVQCVQGAYSAVCRCPACPTLAPTLTLPPGNTLPTTLPPSECSRHKSCEACLDAFMCAFCESSGECIPSGYSCASTLRNIDCPFVPPTAGARSDVDAPQLVMVGNLTVNVTVVGEFDQPLGIGKSFMWVFEPAVAISWIELYDFNATESARLTVTRKMDGATDTITITDKRQDLISRTESGFNMYLLESLNGSEFKINTLSIVSPTSTPKTEPPPPPPPPVVPMVSSEPGSGSDSLVIGLIVAGVLFLLAAIAIVFLVVRRGRRRDNKVVGSTQIEQMPVQVRESMYGNFHHASGMVSAGDNPSHYSAAPGGTDISPTQAVVYTDAPSVRDRSYTDPRRSGMSMYDQADSPMY